MSYLTNDQKTKIKQVNDFCNSIDEISKEALTASGWDVNAAVNYFWDQNLTLKIKGNTSKVVENFKKYLDKDVINGENFQKFMDDSGVVGDDHAFFVIIYFANCKTLGEITKDELTSLSARLKLNTTDEIKQNLDKVRGNLKDEKIFEGLYKYLFKVFLEPPSRCLAYATALYLWKALLPYHFKLHAKFIQFIESLPENKKKDHLQDTWNMVWEFEKEVRGDLSQYDEMGAWPPLLDEFVEYAKKTN